MDNLFEILVPIVFAAIYFFGNMLSGKSDDTSESTPRRDEDPDAAERQRRIQEEIRRKIMQRRNEGEGAPPHSMPAPDLSRRMEQKPDAPVERRREIREQQKSSPASTKSQPESPAEAAFDWDTSDNAYADGMQAQLQQIEATKRRAEKLKKQAAAQSSGSAGASSRRTDTPRRHERASQSRARSRAARRPVRSTLRDPATARAAFIYSEVLGTPVSQRKVSSVPGLSQS